VALECENRDPDVQGLRREEAMLIWLVVKQSRQIDKVEIDKVNSL
jgi:hypothetical protein